MNLAAALTAVVLTITTQNVKVGMDPDHARHDIRQAAEHSSVVITQEMGYRHTRLFAPKGWASAHFMGSARGDCATFWDKAVWTERRHWTNLLTTGAFKNGHRYSLTTILRGQGTVVAVVCIHMITRWGDRIPTEREGMRNLGALLHRLTARYPHVVVGGDWNRRWANRARFTGFRSQSPSKATFSPHASRIDYFQWHGARVLRQRVVGHTYSDHNGLRTHLRLTP